MILKIDGNLEHWELPDFLTQLLLPYVPQANRAETGLKLDKNGRVLKICMTAIIISSLFIAVFGQLSIIIALSICLMDLLALLAIIYESDAIFVYKERIRKKARF